MKRWNVLNEYSESADILETLLNARGVSSPDGKEAFLNPPPALYWAKKFSPELKESLKQAKSLILKAIEEEKPIVIHGDYDADGICATAILYNTIKYELGHENLHAFIPNRFEHGYGLSMQSIDAVVQKLNNPKNLLVITVDSGITSVKEAEYIKQLGYEIIITDHHQKSSELPKPDVLVWSDQIVGAGIAWFLSKVIGSKDPQSLALAAIATVTDLQPLLNTNRSIVKEGLKVLNSNPPAGIKKLLQVAGRSEREITSYELGWIIGPRLNAAGRLVDATDSLLLLIDKDENLLEKTALLLNETNNQRQDKTLEMYEFASVSTEKELPKILISSHADYHEGIIGLVAAKLAQKYYRPAIVISLSDDYGKGSVRSIPGIDIISVLREHEELFEKVGGHPMAAGFTIHKDNIPTLVEKVTSYCTENFEDSLFEPIIDIDVKIPFNKINMELAEIIDGLKPFGIGNGEPVFMSENAGIASVSFVGKEGRHTSFRFYSNGNYFKGIFFNGAEQAQDLKTGDIVDLVYKLKLDEYNGSKKVTLVIEDFKKHV